MKVIHDEDGNAHIDDRELQRMLTPYQRKIQELEYKLAATNEIHAKTTESKNKLDRVLNEKDSYKQAETTLGQARAYVNDVILEWQRENGIGGAVSSNQALRLLKGTEVEEELTKNFKGVDLMSVLFGYDSEDHLRRALDDIIETRSALEEEELQTSSVSAALESGRLSPEDILNASDDAIEKLLAKYENEE